MYKALNIDKNNKLHSLYVIYEMNLLNPIILLLGNICQIQMKVLQCPFYIKKIETKQGYLLLQKV